MTKFEQALTVDEKAKLFDAIDYQVGNLLFIWDLNL